VDYFIIIAAGALVAMQAGTNAAMQKSLQNPFLSSAVSFAGGLLSLLLVLSIYMAFDKAPLPRAHQWAAAPWWAWTGGALGAVYVLTGVLTVEKVGTGVFVCMSVTASILASLAIDHFGLVGMHRHTVSPGRLIGGALMVAGMLLIGKF
jgi:bacterial/archaeal transporter family-2 protein